MLGEVTSWIPTLLVDILNRISHIMLLLCCRVYRLCVCAAVRYGRVPKRSARASQSMESEPGPSPAPVPSPAPEPAPAPPAPAAAAAAVAAAATVASTSASAPAQLPPPAHMPPPALVPVAAYDIPPPAHHMPAPPHYMQQAYASVPEHAPMDASVPMHVPAYVPMPAAAPSMPTLNNAAFACAVAIILHPDADPSPNASESILFLRCLNSALRTQNYYTLERKIAIGNRPLPLVQLPRAESEGSFILRLLKQRTYNYGPTLISRKKKTGFP